MSVRDSYIPYARQSVDQHDIDAVVAVLQSNWLTTGPYVAEFERAMCEQMKVTYGTAVSSGTAALHCAVHAVGISHGDEVIVSPITFAASANCILYQGGTPVFADVDYETMLISPQSVKNAITERTKAVIAVDYAGQPCDYVQLRQICDDHNLALIGDCAHSLGASLYGKTPAQYADCTTYSFHPVKHITSGEGGLVLTDNPEFAQRIKLFRNHGIDADHMQREKEGAWMYRMVELGYNYRISDFQCALATSQLKKLEGWLQRRAQIAARYDEVFGTIDDFDLLTTISGGVHAHHLYVLRLAPKHHADKRQQMFDALRQLRIGVNVHYIPIYHHLYYKKNVNQAALHCPNAEAAFERILSLPMYGTMTDAQVERVIDAVLDSLAR